MNLRLEKILGLVNHDYVLDVGSDHGILPLRIIEEGRAKKVLATDISPKSLEKLRLKLDKDQDKIELMVTDGLTGIVGPFPDLCIIAGMGGTLIIDILAKDPEKTKEIPTFIFQSNTQVKELRAYLLENGFTIRTEESVVDEGIYYNIIMADRGPAQDYDPWDLAYGKILLENKDKDTRDKIEADKLRLEVILAKLEEKDLDQERQGQIREELELIGRALEYYED